MIEMLVRKARGEPGSIPRRIAKYLLLLEGFIVYTMEGFHERILASSDWFGKLLYHEQGKHSLELKYSPLQAWKILTVENKVFENLGLSRRRAYTVGNRETNGRITSSPFLWHRFQYHKSRGHRFLGAFHKPISRVTGYYIHCTIFPLLYPVRVNLANKPCPFQPHQPVGFNHPFRHKNSGLDKCGVTVFWNTQWYMYLEEAFIRQVEVNKPLGEKSGGKVCESRFFFLFIIWGDFGI